MDNHQIFTVKLSSIERLKELFKISAELDENSIINFLIDSSGFAGVAKNSTESCYKTWSIEYDDEFKPTTELTSELKCSIYKGKDFISKILKHFERSSSTVEFSFFYDEISYSVKVIHLSIFKEGSSKADLSFKMTTANVSIHYDLFDEELLHLLFDDDFKDITITHRFELSSEEIKQLKSLNSYKSNDELHKQYLRFEFENNILSITDGLFKRTYEDKTVEILQRVDKNLELSKELFNLISKSPQKVLIKKYEDNYLMSFESTEKTKEKTAFILLKQLDLSINYEDIFNDEVTFDS